MLDLRDRMHLYRNTLVAPVDSVLADSAAAWGSLVARPLAKDRRHSSRTPSSRGTRYTWARQRNRIIVGTRANCVSAASQEPRDDTPESLRFGHLRVRPRTSQGDSRSARPLRHVIKHSRSEGK